MHKNFLCILFLCGSVVAPYAAAQVSPQRDPSTAAHSGAAAVVNGHAISKDEVDRIAMRRYGQEILDILIDNYLIDQEAARLHVEVSEAEVDNQVQALVDAIKPKTLEEGLKQHHQSIAEVRDDIRHRLLALKLAAMDSNPGRFVHVHVIFIQLGAGNSPASADAEALARMTSIQKQLQSGASFDEMARQYSQDPTGKERGGDIGILFKGYPYDPRVVHAALELKAGMTTDKPVKTPSGYYLIMVSSTGSTHPADEDTLYSDAGKQYEMYQGSRNLPTYMNGLRSKADITEFLKP